MKEGILFLVLELFIFDKKVSFLWVFDNWLIIGCIVFGIY